VGVARLDLAQVAAARLLGSKTKRHAVWTRNGVHKTAVILLRLLLSRGDEARRQFMTNRPQAAGLVAVFLRDSLAGGALAVTELDARARAAGLLGERQSITHIRVFKRAKKSLGIRSLRAGFVL
jgi:hypothetical protein